MFIRLPVFNIIIKCQTYIIEKLEALVNMHY